MKNINIVYGLLITAGTVLVSCEKSEFLNKAPLSFTSPENFYKTESDLKIALAGCYDPINTSRVAGTNVADGTYYRGLLFMLGGGNDEVVPNVSNELADFGRFSYLPTNSSLSALWTGYFAGISRTNLLLEKAEVVAMNEQTKKRIIGEARFLRAFYYYHLAVTFGAVPISVDYVPNNQASRESLEKVYTLIMDDLNYAYTNLSATPIFAGGATKWAAGGYLSVVYNYLASSKRFSVGASLNFPLNSFGWVNEVQMTANAKTVLEDVISNSGYQLVAKNNYSHLFRETTKAEQNKECLFLAEGSESIADEYPEISNFPIPNGDRNTYGGGYGRLRPTRELYNAYNVNDIRRNQNITGSFTAASTKETVGGGVYYVPIAPSLVSMINWCTGKFRCIDPKTKTIGPANTSLSYPLLRFADILLQYSEALYFSGDEVAARNYLSKIRERIVNDGTPVATLNTAYYKADFVTELLDERKRELCFETKRRIDLIRFNKLEAAVMSISPTAGNLNQYATEMRNNYEYFKIWFPIPQSQIDVNGNLQQNVGY